MAGFVFLLLGNVASSREETSGYWLDLYRGEEVSREHLLEDLLQADVIYIGETHTLERHHRIQAEVLEGLTRGEKSLALALEQIEARHQVAVDRFNKREIDFNQLAAEINWKKQWRNFEQYRELCELAQKNNVPLYGLNAPAEIIHAIGRGSLKNLPEDQRSQLPEEIITDDPAYEKLMNLLLAVHMTMDPEKLHSVFEAQVARDETMAENILKASENRTRTVVVICGSGHVSYGLGMPDRVRRRNPEVKLRILVSTESGDLKLSEREKAMRRNISISHDDLRSLARPLADYLNVTPRKPKEEK